ncbi:MAG: DUF1802 family protein [Chthoniobacterales bacterium]
MGSIGFKEWALVCEALGRGEASVLLRKGGIAEGREGFAFRHVEFFLFPTFFHAQARATRLSDPTLPVRDEDQIEVGVFAKVEETSFVSDWQTANALAPLHVLKEEIVRERFEYDGGNGIHVAFVRAFRLAPVWRFASEARYGGCRSWVKLPEPPDDLHFEPVLSEEEHSRRLAQFRAVVDRA